MKNTTILTLSFSWIIFLVGILMVLCFRDRLTEVEHLFLLAPYIFIPIFYERIAQAKPGFHILWQHKVQDD